MKQKSKYNLQRVDVTVFDYQARLAKENMINMSEALREALDKKLRQKKLLKVHP